MRFFFDTSALALGRFPQQGSLGFSSTASKKAWHGS